MTRLLGPTLVAGVLGGVLAVLGGRQPWTDGPVLGTPTAPDAHASVAVSLGTVVLAGTLVVAVSRTRGRRITGLVVGAAALGVLAAVLTADADWVGARFAALAGGLLGLAAGAATLTLGHRWAQMSGRYDAPGATRGSEDPWQALDRGEDPTV